MKDKFPKVSIDTMTFGESRYKRNGYTWLAATLVAYAKRRKLKPFKLPLAGFDSGVYNLSSRDMNINEIAYQFKRVQTCDLKYPIILDDNGSVADGYHRIIKAMCLGYSYVWAIRLPEMPPYDIKAD